MNYKNQKAHAYAQNLVDLMIEETGERLDAKGIKRAVFQAYPIVCGLLFMNPESTCDDIAAEFVIRFQNQNA